MRAVVDTNAVVSALLFRSEASRLLDCWVAGGLRLVVSPAILEEYRRVLLYPRFRLTAGEAEGLVVDHVLPYADLIEPTERLRVCRDEHDDKFLECGVAAGADAVVSGDQDLLVLGPQFRGVRILSVRQALAELTRA